MGQNRDWSSSAEARVDRDGGGLEAYFAGGRRDCERMNVHRAGPGTGGANIEVSFIRSRCETVSHIT